MDIEELKQVIRLLKEEGLSEITVWEGESRITVRQGALPSGAGDYSRPEVEESRHEAMEEGTFTVTSTLVGTFYRRPAPDEESYVNEGDTVKAGDTLGIIEAMKVLNEITARESGRLKRILVEDGTAVEYGQPLFLFERL